MLENNLINDFKKYFHEDNDAVYFSPGRINIIGEHIDYNGGHVMPMAISLGVTGVIKWTDKPIINIVSIDISDKIYTIDMNDYAKTNDYLDYIRGILYFFKEDNHIKNYDKGMDIYLSSTLPASSGLSSSAAIELLFSHIINDYYECNLSNLDLVYLSLNSERKYIGVNCGIMDQFAIGMSEVNKVIYLDTNSIEYNFVPFSLKDKELVIINTKKPRNLVESKYNERRSECEKVRDLLNKKYNKSSLCKYSIEELDSIKDLITNAEYKRSYHAITEEARVQKAIMALNSGDLPLLGELLKASHESLQNDYEVSGIELDTICSFLNNNKYCLGARMTGAGFGGCAIALFDTNNHDIICNVIKELKIEYNKKTNLNLEYYFVKSSDKTHKVI